MQHEFLSISYMPANMASPKHKSDSRQSAMGVDPYGTENAVGYFMIERE